MIALIQSNPFILATIAAAVAAGFVRGFTGFGGPAFMLAVLTLFFPPVDVIGQILIIEFVATCYLFAGLWRQIDWRSTLPLAAATVATMPFGHWLLTHTDASSMKLAIAILIIIACVLMLTGFRYKAPLSAGHLVVLGLIGGLIFGASYIALIVVAVVLMGPYNKGQSRTLIISWNFIIAIWYIVISFYRDNSQTSDIIDAIPATVAYLVGTWFGAQLFDASNESGYRKAAICTLLGLGIISIIL